ncbi:NADH:flavin oxidoreductase/NADH oxidase family protein [Auricularia subglabra TFB-10046 SS5]|nr:NADH:flavin oxidoreductase/NADH oxidase family protein [Auricularia subglabra TFB-10046 SS5]
MAPLTRYRAGDDHVPVDIMVEYYTQRASVPGTLLIAEATIIDPRAGTFANVPGIYTDAQVAAWKKIVDVVHAKGSFIYLQLWTLGRVADEKQLKSEVPGADVVSASDIRVDDEHAVPRPLTVKEIDDYVSWFARAAKNAVEGAGFDGVELHGASGYLIDQFIQDVSNKRTDEYGGSIGNRLRFPLRAVDAVIAAVGAERTAIRLSPWNLFQGMREKDPITTFSALLEELAKRRLAYVNLVESRVDWVGGGDPSDNLLWARKILKPYPLILSCGFTPDTAIETAQEAENNGEQVLIAFGRNFISNPDLPKRIKFDIPLTPYDRDTFFTPKTTKGYTDYPAADVFEVST